MNDYKERIISGDVTTGALQEKSLEIFKYFQKICKEHNLRYWVGGGTLIGALRHQGFIPWDDDLDVLMLREDYNRLMAEGDRVLDREKFFLQKEFSDHWPLFFSKLRLNGTACIEKYHAKDPMIHHGVYMDIFPCDDAAGTEFGRRIQYLASKIVITKCLDKRGYDTNSTAKKVVMALCRLLPLKPFVYLAKKGSKKRGLVHTFLGGGRKYSKNIFARTYLAERTQGQFEGKTYPIPRDFDTLLTMLYGDYMTLPPEEERVIKQHAVLVDLENSYEKYIHYLDGVEFDIYTRSIR